MAIRWMGRRALIGLGVVALVLATWFLAGRGPSLPIEPRIAILPFIFTGDAADEFFADGVTDMITSELASFGDGLHVVSRNSTARFKNTEQPLVEVGAQIDADFILTGAIRTGAAPNGQRLVRVTPVLIRVEDNTEVWSDSYTAALASEVFATQEEIATAVAQAMNAALTPNRNKALQSLGFSA